MIASLIANTAPNRRAGSKTFKPEDFMPKAAPVRRTSKAFRGEFFGAFGDRIKPAKKK